MLRIFRKNKKRPGEVLDVQLRPAELSGQDPLEQRLKDTRRQLGQRLGALLSSHATIDEDLLEEIETTLITADISVQAAMDIVKSLRMAVGTRSAIFAPIAGTSSQLPMCAPKKIPARPLSRSA